jgi:tetraacyldisaccharide 4'-kinase
MPLLDLSNPYAHIMRIRRELYRRGVLKWYHPGIPVISIGNLSVGGTGKSPLTILIAEYLERKHGKKVAIVSRGYNRRSTGYLLVRDGTSILAKVDQSGDEAQMIAERLPRAIVVVDEDRIHGARQATMLGSQVILLDDGFQHLRLGRDLNILLIDAQQPFPRVLPFGLGREPLDAAADADIVLFTNCAETDRSEELASRLAPKLSEGSLVGKLRSLPSELEDIVTGAHVDLMSLQGAKILAVSSIASPGRFHEMLRSLGAKVIVHSMRDHAPYTGTVVQKILEEAIRHGVGGVVTTEKDAVKSRHLYAQHSLPSPVLVLKHELEFLSGEEGFYQRLDLLF